MPGKSMPAIGNELFDVILNLSAVTYPTLAANASTTTTITVPGLQPLDFVSWSMQSPPAHLTIDNMYVSALNTLSVLWGTDSTGISTGSVQLLLEVVRVDGANLGTSIFPANFLL